jgi:signal transduction histidine kinase
VRLLLVAGLLSSSVVAAAGLTLGGYRLGWSDEASFARVERHVRAHFDEMAASLQEAALSVAGRTELIARTAADPDAARDLFAAASDTTSGTGLADLAITVYSPGGAPLAWSGRPSEIPVERVAGPSALFVAPGPLGLRLVHVEPVSAGDPASAGARLATIAAERVLSPAPRVESPAHASFELDTPIAPVVLRTRFEGAGDAPGPFAFLIRDASGDVLLEARVSAAELTRARQTYHRNLLGVLVALLAATMLLVIGPALDLRDRARDPASHTRATLRAALLLLGGRALLWLATPARWTGEPLFSPGAYASLAFGSLLRSPIDFLLTSLTLLGLVTLAADGVQRLRLVVRGARRVPAESPLRYVLAIAAAGGVTAALVAAYQLFLGDTIDNTTIDILHFSFHPWSSARLALLFGLVFFSAAVIWIGVLAFHLALSWWRVPRRSPRAAALAVVVWTLPAATLVVLAVWLEWPLPAWPTLLAVAGCAAAGWLGRSAAAWHRHASQASRLLIRLLALLAPAVLIYPSLLHHAHRAKARLVETQFAAQAANHPQELLARLSQSLKEIDGIAALPALVEPLSAPVEGPPPTDAAFLIWRQTDLARFRLTSAVELYGSDGALVSRFALNFPEYTATSPRWHGTSCRWEDIFGEAAPFGSEDRRMLHAERGICRGDGSIVGAIVVHVMLDYDTLPFISSQSPYVEFFRTGQTLAPEGTPGGDIELVIYGWGRHPVYTSATAAWPLPDPIFDRIYASRDPFWTELARGDTRFRVYVVNDRSGIYALGYPVPSAFDHLVHLAELTVLACAGFVGLVLGAALFWQAARARRRPGRLLLREIRESFYRKLFLAFVAASVVPVLILAVLIRAYFATLLRADVEAEAARTAAVAERVIEESAALQQRGIDSLSTVSDDVMVWISQVIDQDVNIFLGPRLIATSERDLFASGLLPTRTPDSVYRAIALQHLPSFVGEDAIGDFPYMLAAAPVTLGGRDAILTVPLATRQQEIEQEIDDLDRGVYLAALLFVLLGAGIGFSMAERIGDPVKRLTRATRRIAHGDFDARIAVRSADELRRLVDAFNSMAAELKDQRTQLERTHRLEAWAEMARQVAHEIKNPLTPIQLSAEHLRRVHADRGEPLSPVLENCVETILAQVRLLRQISAEFSSFASSPTPRLAAVSIASLVAEVAEPYRAGLGGRVHIGIDVPDTLPPVRIDRALVGRALVNIIENALHAIPGRGSIELTARAGDRHVTLSVRDTGMGMDQDALQRIFEPYFSTKAIGTGLGLTIAKRNVESSGGAISVASEKGVGTTVTLELPVEETEN